MFPLEHKHPICRLVLGQEMVDKEMRTCLTASSTTFASTAELYPQPRLHVYITWAGDSTKYNFEHCFILHFLLVCTYDYHNYSPKNNRKGGAGHYFKKRIRSHEGTNAAGRFS